MKAVSGKEVAYNRITQEKEYVHKRSTTSGVL
ncbi:MAG: hypothetical protein HONDAALG_03001 [Gammaproteobacteria bacterium]|nr:hypothetical protein [Gammaproteobacteria bacterium]